MKVKIFGVKGDKPISKAIMACGKMQTGSARVSHIGFLFNDIVTVEALFTGLRSRAWEDVCKSNKVVVYNVPALWAQPSARLQVECFTMLGKFKSMYGFLKLPLMGLDAALSFIRRKPIFFFSKTFSTKWFPICSFFVGRMMWKHAHMEFFKNWRGQSPDFQDDYMRANPDLFPVDKTLTTL